MFTSMFEAEFLTALLSIIAIDIVLAGDNAVVIALASRKLPEEQRTKAIYWGTFGAIIIRALMTIIALWLLRIPYLQVLGGILLIPVAIKLVKQDDSHENISASSSLAGAIQTIIVADAIMGIDNVIAVAGASHGNMLLVILGLLISVPIVIWGSKWISAWMVTYPILVYAGAAILAWTAGGMIMNDQIVGTYLRHLSELTDFMIPLAITALVLLVGKIRAKNSVLK
ncbi:TerC family protein [Pelosinus sp. UFO1]|uniref:TerC family protein n=1 Tax=Pelosinus sp. UFO1 TaxID=484770 RepID=UPI0004D15C2D|nr:TerC family protein [Pelosinus sp. UFO1]AIF52805.1 integral membrane protein, YjbE family [Pelosinus sp. UFO1]